MIKTAESVVPEPNEAIAEGHYAKKQLYCKDRLISWSHRSRFRMGLRLAHKYAAGKVLDYGCGDGTFAAMLASARVAGVEEITGAELEKRAVEDCRARLGGLSQLNFRLVDELDAHDGTAAFDTLFCMEVLEHVVDVERVLDTLARLLAPEGRLIVSVPVETGVPLLVKQAFRRMAGWRGVGDYKHTSSYTLAEYWASIFTGARQHLRRTSLGGEDGFPYHDHKGFNWMLLRKSLGERFLIYRTISSPVSWLSPHLASQVWFVLGKKSATSIE